MKKPTPLRLDLKVKTPLITVQSDGDFNSKREVNTRLSNRDPIEMNGLLFHAELYEVDINGDAVNPSLVDQVNAVTTLCGERPDEIVIDGKHYVPVLFPHSR